VVFFAPADAVQFSVLRAGTDAERSPDLIRPLFCWFIKKKRLIPDALFDPAHLAALLKNGPRLATSEDTLFYKAILQNLSFGEERPMDLSAAYDKKRYRQATVRGLLQISNRHLFAYNDEPHQFAKIRFFISLIVDQQVAGYAGAPPDTRQRLGLRQSSGALKDTPGGKRQQTAALQNLTEFDATTSSFSPTGESRGEGAISWNRGLRPLPNLETKFVAANTLIGIGNPPPPTRTTRRVFSWQGKLKSSSPGSCRRA
jgi:hypothetical protein